MTPVLRVEGVTKRFGQLKALDNVSTYLAEKEILGLVGPNGAGKSTLINVISGFLLPDRGRVTLDSQRLDGLRPDQIARLGIVRTFQMPRLIKTMAVIENILLAFGGQPGEHLAGLFVSRRRVRSVECQLLERASLLLTEVGLASKARDAAATLSYGQQKLLSLTCCLAADPKILLLDEPAAGLSPAMVGTVVEMIKSQPRSGRAVLLIEHNMEVVEALSNRVVFLSSGRKGAEGTLGELRKSQAVMAAYLGRDGQ